MNHAIDSNTLSDRIYCAQVFRERSSDVEQCESLYALMLYHYIHYGFQEEKKRFPKSCFRSKSTLKMVEPERKIFHTVRLIHVDYYNICSKLLCIARTFIFITL